MVNPLDPSRINQGINAGSGRTPATTAEQIRARQAATLQQVVNKPRVQPPGVQPVYDPAAPTGARGATFYPSGPRTAREFEAAQAMRERALGNFGNTPMQPQPVYNPPTPTGPRGATFNPPEAVGPRTPREFEAAQAMRERALGNFGNNPSYAPETPTGPRGATFAADGARQPVYNPPAPSNPRGATFNTASGGAPSAGQQPVYNPPTPKGPRGATFNTPPSKLAALGRGAAVVGAGVEAYNAVQDMTPSGGLDTMGKVARGGEALGRIGAAGAGAGLGAAAGPLGAIVGGGLGYFAPDAVNGIINSLAGTDTQLPSTTAAQNRANTAQQRAVQANAPAQTAPAAAPAPVVAPRAATAATGATSNAVETSAPRLRDALTPVSRIGDMPLASASQLQAGGYAVDGGQPTWNPQDPAAMDIINRQYDSRINDLRWMLGSNKTSAEQRNVLTKAIADVETQRGNALANYGDNATKFSAIQGDNINNRRTAGQQYNQTLNSAATSDNEQFTRRQSDQADSILKAMDINATNDRYAMGDATTRRGQDIDLLRAAVMGGSRSTASADRFDAKEAQTLADQFIAKDTLPTDENGKLTEDGAKELSARQQFFYRNMDGITQIEDPVARRARVEDLRREFGLTQAMNQALDQRGNPNPTNFTRPVRGQDISLGDWLDPMQPSSIDLYDVVTAGQNDFVITQDGRKVPTRALGDMAGNVEAQASLMDAELRGLYGQLARLDPNTAEYTRVQARINQLTPRQ